VHPWQTDPSLWAGLAPMLRAALPADVHGDISVLGAGDDSIAFQVGDYVVRVPRHENAAASQQREACFLPLLAPALPLEVPRPFIVSHDVTDLPPFSLHRRVPGQELLHEAWLAMPRSTQVTLAHGVGSFIQALHSIPIDTVAACGVGVNNPRELFMPLRQQVRSLASLLPASAAAALDVALDRYSAGGAEWAYTPVILHCDLGPSHVLYDPARSVLAGVIDFGDVVIGDPARDFIFLLEDWSPDFLELALQAYPREPHDALMHRIKMSSLLNLVWWTLWVKGKGRDDLFEHGLADLRGFSYGR
jgi:aminoglycoside phosphotransferase (APT) family kinase protein